MPVVALEHVEVDDRGIAALVGTRTKVRQVVLDALAGLSPAQIQHQYPHLSLAQVHAALAYYYDHREAVDAEIAESARAAEASRAAHPNALTRAALEARLSANPATEPPTGA